MKDKCNHLKLIVSFLAFQTFWLSSQAQNLIPNASFEDGKCPFQFTRKQQEFKVADWLLPDSGTPDYYHRCAKKEVTVPFKWAGGQEPVSGDAYLGIYLKKGNYHENVGVPLSETLEAGRTYYGHFYLASVSNASNFPEEISVGFTMAPLQITETSPFDHKEITLPFREPDEFMDFSWQKLSFRYKAKGGEKYFYIGSLTQRPGLGRKSKYRVNREPMLNNASYVFLDDFYLGRSKDYKEPVPVFEFAADLQPLSVFFNFDEDYGYAGAGEQKQLDPWNTWTYDLESWASFFQYDPEQPPEANTKPVLYAAGEKDPSFPPDVIKLAASAIGGPVTVNIFEDAGHQLMLFETARFSDAVHDFCLSALNGKDA